MKKHVKSLSLFWLLLAGHAHAGGGVEVARQHLLHTLVGTMEPSFVRGDYAQQWILNLEEAESGVYQLVLSPEIYQTLQSPGLMDMDVFNAQGQALPAALLNLEFETEASFRVLSLAWFALPQSAQAHVARLVVRSADGSLEGLDAQTPEVASPSSWLVDVGSVRETLQTLVLEWPEEAEPFKHYVEVEGSDDLRQWHVLASKAPLLNMSKEGQALRHHRIELYSRHRYLRLKLLDSSLPLPLTGVRGEFVSREAAPPAWQWRELQGKRVEEEEGTHFEFELDGRFPVERAEVLPQGQEVRRWVLQSRDTPEDVWRTRTEPWLAYVVDMAGTEIRSTPQALSRAYRDRYWRLRTEASAALPDNFSAPALRLFYQPETLVFITQGEPPYALAVGSAKAVRMSSALLQTVEVFRQHEGGPWQPGAAQLGQVQTLAGKEALRPVPKPEPQPEAPAPRDKYPWKTGLLWGILAAGSAVLLLFVLRQLRPPRGDKTPHL